MICSDVQQSTVRHLAVTDLSKTFTRKPHHGSPLTERVLIGVMAVMQKSET